MTPPGVKSGRLLAALGAIGLVAAIASSRWFHADDRALGPLSFGSSDAETALHDHLFPLLLGLLGAVTAVVTAAVVVWMIAAPSVRSASWAARGAVVTAVLLVSFVLLVDLAQPVGAALPIALTSIVSVLVGAGFVAISTAVDDDQTDTSASTP